MRLADIKWVLDGTLEAPISTRIHELRQPFIAKGWVIGTDGVSFRRSWLGGDLEDGRYIFDDLDELRFVRVDEQGRVPDFVNVLRGFDDGFDDDHEGEVVEIPSRPEWSRLWLFDQRRDFDDKPYRRLVLGGYAFDCELLAPLLDTRRAAVPARLVETATGSMLVAKMLPRRREFALMSMHNDFSVLRADVENTTKG